MSVRIPESGSAIGEQKSSALMALWRRLLHTVLPVDCSACGVPLQDDAIPFMCRACWGRIAQFQGPCCPRCGRRFASPMTLIHAPLHRCGDCRRRGPAFSHAWSGYPYEGPLRDAIRLWKYGKRIRLAKPLGRLLADAYVAGTDRVDMLVPVPLHPERLRDRGFNQSLLLADRLARAIEAPVSYTNLARTAAGPAQSVLTRKARLRNLRRAFTVRHPAEIAGKRVLIVDDVFTTGTTVNECAKALRRAGARDVVVATLARVV